MPSDLHTTHGREAVESHGPTHNIIVGGAVLVLVSEHFSKNSTNEVIHLKEQKTQNRYLLYTVVFRQSPHNLETLKESQPHMLTTMTVTKYTA